MSILETNFKSNASQYRLNYAIIAENDESLWHDQTGETYHFPKTYQKLLLPGTQIIYYKGRMLKKSFKDKRMTPAPHYFGTAVIGHVYPDPDSSKGDLYADIEHFTRFSYPIEITQNGAYVEFIPESKKSNYWRNGVRAISREVYQRIISLSDQADENQTNDKNQGEGDGYTSTEGRKKSVMTTVYERDPNLRSRAIEIHGLTCMACGVNFRELYGEWGEGFIHVHHTKPVADGVREVSPKEDMIVLCPNCHSMVHRKKNVTLTLDQLKAMLRKKQ